MMSKWCNLYLGDCRTSLVKNVSDESVDFIATDPPYGIDQMNHEWDDSQIQNSIKDSEKKTCSVKKIPVGMKFDPEITRAHGNFMHEVALEYYRVLKPGSFCVVFSLPRSAHRVGVAFEDAGFEIRDQLIWSYGAGQGKAQGVQNFIKKSKSIPEEEKEELIARLNGMKTPQLTPTFETMWLCQKPREGTFVENYLNHGVGLVDFRSGNQRVCFSHSKPSRNERLAAGEHPTLKPIALMEDLIKVFCPPEGVVLDSFAGSGTTGVAAQRQGRLFIGIEKSLMWYKVMQSRLLRSDKQKE